ncbi:MAG: alpha/beta hydrolase [Pseudomonadota bacterium]
MFSGTHRTVARTWFFALAALVVVASCGRPPELVGVDNPAVPVDSVTTATRHKVFIATTRESSESYGAFFSEERAPELGLASVQVSIPPTHEIGQLERPKRLPPDPRTEFAVVDPTVYQTETAFVNEINRELARRPGNGRDVLFFIHGYNNTTSDAVLRLAQFVEDTDFQGVPVLFDWASAGRITRYVYDMNSALIARPKILETAEILSRTNARGFDVFAHSMGSLLVMEALRDQDQKGRLNQTGRLNNIILASPDVDLDLFRAQMSEIDGNFGDLFVLLSEDDGALRASRRIAGGVPRVGASDANELAELGVIAIDLTEIDDSTSGSHSKFAGSPEVVQLLGNGLNNTQTFDRQVRSLRLGELLDGVPITIAIE